MNAKSGSFLNSSMKLKFLALSVLMLMWIAACSSAPSESPEKVVRKFIQKHIPKIDLSVADFYVKEERAGVTDRIQKFISSKKESGDFQTLSSAKYDFSNINVKVLDQKEEYINDEAVDFTKVAAKGDYTKTVNGTSESLKEDEVFILESVEGKWKVTEELNPWD